MPTVYRRRIRQSKPDEIPVHAVENELVPLVMYGGAHCDDTCCFLALERGGLESRIERISHKNGFEKPRVHFNEADQLVADHVRKESRAGRGECQNLKPVCERRRMAERPAVFDIVVDRMIVQTHGLEGGEVRLADRSRWRSKHLANAKFIEGSLRNYRMLSPVWHVQAARSWLPEGKRARSIKL